MSEAWISVEEDGLPGGGGRVRFHWLNVLGKHRTTEGVYDSGFTVEIDGLEDLPDEDCDWRHEVPYRKRGWYEEPQEGEYYYPVSDVTHWMPLSASPEQ